MKKLVVFAAMALLLASCGAKPEKTIENLKAAITGESNASAKYAKFAEKATADSMFNVAAMFRATSKAEEIHAKNHTAALNELGVTDFTPVIEEVVVGTALENLAAAKEGEDYEQQTMYPEFITVATAEGADKASSSFNWAMVAEGKHSSFYNEAIAAITADGNDANFTALFVVCPLCGDTYKQSDAAAACDLCGTAGDKFLTFPL